MGNKCYFSNGVSNARGVAILLNKSLDCKVILVARDEEGRMLLLEVKIGNHVFTLCNVYGPNKDCPDFFENVAKVIEKYNENIVLMGDFNVALDAEKDKYFSKRNKTIHVPNKTKARAKLIEIIDRLILADVWRARYPNKLCFSWYKRNPALLQVE